jgi:serine/threonine protein kinase
MLRVLEPRALPEAQTCPFCAASSAGSRCEECGGALAPGGYRPLRLLSHKAHARVFVARAPGGEPVVVKELSFHLAPDAAAIDAFERESRLLAELNHPRIPRVLDCFGEGSGARLRLYQVQTFAEGRSLQAWVAEGPLPEETVREIGRQLLETLAAIHGRAPPLVHRDLKPANLIWRQEGGLTVVDFGAARDLLRGETHGATLVGTFGYMAPEQLGGTVSPASDLYGAGATLLHLLTGRAPAELMRDGVELELPASLPKGWRGFFEGSLARSPRDRFANAQEALAALEEKRSRRATRGSRHRLFTTALGAALAVAASGSIIFVAARHDAPAVRPAVVLDAKSPVGRAFSALETAQVESAKMSALFQLAYGSANSPFPADADARLVPLLDDPSSEVRAKTAQVLGLPALDGTAAIGPLLQAAAHDPVADVRVAATVAAGKRLAHAPQDEHTAQLAHALVERMFEDTNENVRVFAGSALASIHPLLGVDLERVRRGLHDGPPKQRNQMMAILIAHVADLHATEAGALRLLDSENAYDRELGIVFLSKLPATPSALDGLAKRALEDPVDVNRDDAVRVLVSIGAQAAPAATALSGGSSRRAPSAGHAP